jgi:peptide deformylase
MALLKILHYPDPVLRRKGVPVTEFDDDLKQLAEDMAETMYAAPGIGLAAPQVGVSKRLVVIDCAPKDEPPQLMVLVNPEIAEGEGECFEEEGCLSVPDFYAQVHHNRQVTIRYQDLGGKPHQLAADGLLAIACQHEIDHLNGILFVDHLSPLKRSMFRKKWQKLEARQMEIM